jgi:hypothetical protein
VPLREICPNLDPLGLDLLSKMLVSYVAVWLWGAFVRVGGWAGGGEARLHACCGPDALLEAWWVAGARSHDAPPQHITPVAAAAAGLLVRVSVCHRVPCAHTQVYDPQLRVTARAALGHEYFREIAHLVGGPQQH